MNPNYLQSHSALFGASSTSTPSASSSNVDSMSPHNRGTNQPGNAYGLVPEPVNPLPSFVPPFYADRRTPDVTNPYLTPGVDSGDAISGFTANVYSSPYLNNLTGRIPKRHPLDDVSLPLPRAGVPSFHSPVSQLELPLPGRTWAPQRTPWGDPAMLDWPRLSGEGSRNDSSESGDEGRQRGVSARAPSESSPLSIPQTLHRTHSGPPPLASPVGGYDYPKSAAYPGNLYSDLVGEPHTWAHGQEVTGPDCGQALAIYEHLFSSLPHLRPIQNGSADSPPSLQPLLDLSSEGIAIFSSHQGSSQPYAVEMTSSNSNTHPSTPNPAPPQATAKRVGKDKGQTKCLGCGATETPEWRRGPMGPRTLCNACGLVHMKLQRKRKKQDEKLAAAKAAAESGEVVELPPAVKSKKVKRDEEG